MAAFSGIGFPVLAALAMAEISASRALVMTALLPMCTAVWGSFVEGSRQPPCFWAAGLGATALVVAYAGTAGTPGWPEAAMGAGMLMSAVGYTDGARLTRELGGLRAWCWALVVAEGVALPLWAGVTWAHPPSGSAGAWLAFAYMAGVSSFLGFVAWYKGMALGGIARTSQLQSVQPMIGLIWAALLLGEPLTLSLSATALGVAGLVAWGRRRGRADRVRAAGTARERL